MDSILEKDELGAFCRHTHVTLSHTREGPLSGLTFGAKDIYDIAGHRTGFGSPDWLRTHPEAARTAPVVQQLLDAGADMVGKTHTDELTFSLNGENAHYGTPVNVNAPGRIPGGSSSGSAAAVAGGLVDFALGSDTGGSVRAPASFCGIYGIRPTHGRVSLEGACPLSRSLDTAGWFARDPDIMERVGAVLFGEPDCRELARGDQRRSLGRRILVRMVHAASVVRAGEFGSAHVSEVAACDVRSQCKRSTASGRGNACSVPSRRRWAPVGDTIVRPLRRRRK